MIEKRELILKSLSPILHNKTHSFLLDSLGLDRDLLLKVPIPNKIDTSMSVMGYFGYINTYIVDKNHHNVYKNGLVMLFNPNLKALENWNFIQTIFEGCKGYNYSEDIGIGLVTVGMNIYKKEWYKLKDLLISGQYSKFDKQYVSYAFNKYDGIRSYYNRQGMICLKTDHAKKMLEDKIGQEVDSKQEYEEKPNLEEEILDISKLQFNY